jgi:pentatricopeptide repeat protein
MERRGVPSDYITYSAVITACEQSGAPDDALRLYGSAHDERGLWSHWKVAMMWHIRIPIELSSLNHDE